MSKFYLINLNALGASLNNLKGGNVFKLNISIQGKDNLFQDLDAQDILIGLDEFNMPQISTIYETVEVIDSENIKLKKIIEAYPGCKITNNALIANVHENIIVEIDQVLFNEIYDILIPKLSKINLETENTGIKKNRAKFGINRLYYGVPGCGKSYTVKNATKDMHTTRVVFHPDYTYSDFVGQILPKFNPATEKVEYPFTPGPFTNILKYAEEHPAEKCCLVIEELNRGNAPAVFGELFQLLDRTDDGDNVGESEYGVTNADVAKIVYKDENREVKIPSNLSIYATMNTSDQNVFTLDTAFQRRWFMSYIPNNFLDDGNKGHSANIIKGTKITWGAFATTVNDVMYKDLNNNNSEDKGLGTHFAIKADLDNKERFAEKVLKYLWDDVFKYDRSPIFDTDKIASFGDMLNIYYQEADDALQHVLNGKVYAEMLNANSKFVINTQEDDA